MKEPRSTRLLKAFTYFGGGLSVGPGAPNRKLGNEFPQLLQLFQHTFGGKSGGTLGQFERGQPLLALSESLGLDFANKFPGLESSYNANIAPVIASGGALTKPQIRDVNQATDVSFAARNMTRGNQAFTSEFLNRDAAKQQRFNTALNQAGTVQGLESGGLNQLTGVEGSITGNYGGIVDPLLSYAGNLFGGNQQAQLSNQQANQNKGAAIPGTVGSVLGNIIGGVVHSDKRLKEKIKGTGEKGVGGIPIKTFRYKDDPGKQRFIGYLSQDVKKKFPGAVVRMPTGMEAVRFPFWPRHFPSSTGDDQTIRAKTGEYIIPEEVVQKKGTAFFDKMVKAETGRKAGGVLTASGLIGYKHGGKVGKGGIHTGWDGKDFDLAPLSAYTPGRGNRRMEGRNETASGDPIHTFESFLRGHSKYVTGATRHRSHIGKTVMRHIGNHLVPVKITDYGPGVKGIDIASENPHFARNFPFQGQIERTGRTLGRISRMPGQIAGRIMHPHGRGRFPHALGRSGFPRAIPVDRMARYQNKLRMAHGGERRGGGPPGFAGPGGFTTAWGPSGFSYPGGSPGFPSSVSPTDTGGQPGFVPPDFNPSLTQQDPYSNPSYDPYVFQQFDPWTYQDFTAFQGESIPASYGGTGGGIQ